MRFKHLLLVLVLVMTALTVAACGDSDDNGDNDNNAPLTYETITVQTAFDALEDNDSAVIVDVRQPEEWAMTGHPPEAVLLPLAEVQSRAPGELAKDTPVYVICNSGNRSREASQTLIGLGYQEVYNVDGGIQAWLQANLPVEAYTP